MLRNKEFRRFALLFVALAAALVTIGFLLTPEAGILALACALVFGTSFFVFTKARYRSLAQISSQIDLVLHNADRLDFSDAEEGELSILHSEITKMTQRIREQNDTLKKDRQYLADSLADVAHQLRTPLTSANLILSFLAKNPDEEQRQSFLHELEGLLVQMDWLITSLLKISRVDAGVVAFQRDNIGMNALIQSVVQRMAISLELRGIEIALDVPDDVLIQGDFDWLGEALGNILKNGVESIGENGRIEIICVDNALYTELSIHDSGGGFPKEDLPYVFDRFYRGKSSNATGYGIGLALCKMILTRQGALIAAKNHPQGGAQFVIHFAKMLD